MGLQAGNLWISNKTPFSGSMFVLRGVLLNKPWIKDPTYQPITRRKRAHGLNHWMSQVIGQSSDWWLRLGNLLLRHTSSWESTYKCAGKMRKHGVKHTNMYTSVFFTSKVARWFFARLCYQECKQKFVTSILPDSKFGTAFVSKDWKNSGFEDSASSEIKVCGLKCWVELGWVYPARNWDTRRVVLEMSVTT